MAEGEVHEEGAVRLARDEVLGVREQPACQRSGKERRILVMMSEQEVQRASVTGERREVRRLLDDLRRVAALPHTPSEWAVAGQSRVRPI